MSTVIAKAENFILKNARPLDYELYRFQKSLINRQDVLNALRNLP